ncbi:MAG: radical SAM family heme chaperone HemW [bacterium]|nr:radical SAM family heme chaperone HemW [bacterium]
MNLTLSPTTTPQRAGLYIHIPFCRKKCHYCDFYSTAAATKGRIDEFIAALRQEMELQRSFWPDEYDTLYLGGGTPSLLSLDQLAEIIDTVRKTFPLTQDAEQTIEANPDDITLDYLRGVRSLGFNRLSLGLQSLRDENLIWLGRRHKATQGLWTIEAARQAGFNNLSLDLIFGLPERLPAARQGQNSLSLWLWELDEAICYEPEHLSCYQLSYEPHTLIMRQKQQGLIQPLTEAEEADYFLETSALLESRGYLHYEVSNFSRGGKWLSRHNQKYWQHIPYLGLGPSAHSFARGRRYWNHRSLSLYCQTLKQGSLPIAGEEILGPEELRLETLYLGFRTRQGIHLTEFCRRFGQNLLSDPPGLANRLIDEGKLEVRGEWLCPTRQGLAIADALALMW